MGPRWLYEIGGSVLGTINGLGQLKEAFSEYFNRTLDIKISVRIEPNPLHEARRMDGKELEGILASLKSSFPGINAAMEYGV